MRSRFLFIKAIQKSGEASFHYFPLKKIDMYKGREWDLSCDSEKLIFPFEDYLKVSPGYLKYS